MPDATSSPQATPEKNGGSRPVPDPTVLTTNLVDRAIEAERAQTNAQVEVLEERLRGIDKATDLRLGPINDIPHQIDEKVGHLQALHNEKFSGIATQFKERDERGARESRDNKVAVDAAFAAQKEAAAAQDKSNREAIDKSEKATAETIKTNQELSGAKTDSLTKSVDELKLQVNGLLSQKVGATENRSGLYAALGVVVSLMLVGMTILGFILHR